MDSNLTTIQILLIIIIPAVISAVPPIIGAFTAKKTRAREKAELRDTDAGSAQKLADAYEKVVDDLQTRIDKMEARQRVMEEKLEKQNKRIYHLEQGVYKLVTQVRTLGAEPVFTLDEPKREG